MNTGHTQASVAEKSLQDDASSSRNQKITADAFLSAFSEEWNETDATVMNTYLDDYSDDTAWTDHMIKGDDSFIGRVTSRIIGSRQHLMYRNKEIYTIDASITDNSNLLGRAGLGYPTRIFAAIEHENGDFPEEEMWKLLWWRCPLKVIIFYDWNEYNKTTVLREGYLERKMLELNFMKRRVNEFLSAGDESKSDQSEYLILIGQRKEVGSKPTWRYCVLDMTNEYCAPEICELNER